MVLFRRAEIEAAIRKKRKCEKEALAIVEYMVENLRVDSQWLVEKVLFQ